MCVKVSVAAVLAAAMVLMASAVFGLSYNFESPLILNGESIGSTSGLVFSSVNGSGMRYANINSGWYSMTSDNGTVKEDGDYFISGNVAGYVLDSSDQGKVSFANGTANWFTVGYSSEFQFVVDAYSSTGSLLTSSTGLANSKASGGTGLAYLTVTHPGISYVVLHDHGGHWMVDNITTDAPVPEPASCMALLTGLMGMGWRIRKRRV
jgi:hypothetical protein